MCARESTVGMRSYAGYSKGGMSGWLGVSAQRERRVFFRCGEFFEHFRTLAVFVLGTQNRNCFVLAQGEEFRNCFVFAQGAAFALFVFAAKCPISQLFRFGTTGEGDLQVSGH